MARRKSTAKIADNNNNTSGQQQQSSTFNRTMARNKSGKQAKTTTKKTKGRPKGKTKQPQQQSQQPTISVTKRGRKPGKKSTITTNEPTKSTPTKTNATKRKRTTTNTIRLSQNRGIRRRHYYSISMKLKASREYMRQKLSTLKNQLQLIREAQKDPDLARKMIIALERYCDKVVDRVRIKRKSRHKISKTAKINEIKNKKIDLNTPQSILCDYNWTQLLNRRNFDRLPAYYQYRLTKLLPKCDQQLLDSNVICPTETAFTNEFFSRAVNNYFNRLVEGKLTNESLAKIKREIEKTKNRLDPLKLKYFEPVFRTPEQDLPKPMTDQERYQQGMAFMNAFVHCVDKVKQTQHKKQRLLSANQQQPSTSANPPQQQQLLMKKRLWDHLPSLTTYTDPRVQKMMDELSIKPKRSYTIADVEKNPNLAPYLNNRDMDRFVHRKISSLMSQLSIDIDPRLCYRSCDSPPSLSSSTTLRTTIDTIKVFDDDRFDHQQPASVQSNVVDEIIKPEQFEQINDVNVNSIDTECNLEIEQLNLDDQQQFDHLLLIMDQISRIKNRQPSKPVQKRKSSSKTKWMIASPTTLQRCISPVVFGL